MTQQSPRQPAPNPSIHQLQGRTEKELTWFQRRSLVVAAGMWVAAGRWPAAQAQARSNVVELRGDVLRNGEALAREQSIAPGEIGRASCRETV